MADWFHGDRSGADPGAPQIGYHALNGNRPDTPCYNKRYAGRTIDPVGDTLMVDQSKWDNNSSIWRYDNSNTVHKGLNMLFTDAHVNFFPIAGINNPSGFTIVWGGGNDNLHATWHE